MARKYIVTRIVDVKKHKLPYDSEGKKLFKTIVIEHINKRKEIKMNFISNGSFSE